MTMTVEEQIRQAYEAGYSEGYADGQDDSAEENGKYEYRIDDDDFSEFGSRNFDKGWALGYDAGWKDCETASELDFEDSGDLI